MVLFFLNLLGLERTNVSKSDSKTCYVTVFSSLIYFSKIVPYFKWIIKDSWELPCLSGNIYFQYLKISLYLIQYKNTKDLWFTKKTNPGRIMNRNGIVFNACS